MKRTKLELLEVIILVINVKAAFSGKFGLDYEYIHTTHKSKFKYKV